MSAPTEPGLYAGVPEHIYHGDRNSLSSTGARQLLKLSPHRWRYEQEHPPAPSADMEWGTAVHTLVLGVGAPPIDTGFDKWQSNDAKARVAEIREAGGIPLRPKEFDAVHQAAENLRNHERVRRWLASGEPELSVYYRDLVTGVMLRARADWVHWIDERTALILDVKKSRAAGPGEFRESVEKFGYDCQQDWYQAAFAAHGITTAFEFGVICSDPPYEPYVVDLSDRYFEPAAERNRRAIDIYAACRESGHWPSWGDGDHSTRIEPSRRAAYKEDYAA
ncbi:PD-(D/E)XK nuclease-like domain-containing protein [Nocardia abscessus]|uniref:PD-(D/E)XK nuclease-like domain-containing protein n=1 Tax=Nocardia abscessus TaxID=120957 RepID=UPI00245682B6|nr:PD-(D/E)XK nuclease-like domain-containing protein [Nocardia abscessus]